MRIYYAPMTNYPTYGLDSFWEVWEESPRHALEITALAIEIADWSPRKWAREHDDAIDLPSAWWMAWYAAGLSDELAKDYADIGDTP